MSRFDKHFRDAAARCFIYHHPCMDGTGAAVAARHAWGDGVVLLGGAYNAPPPEFQSGAEVVCADVSWDVDTMRAMRERASHLTLIDHHPKPVETLQGREGDVADRLVLDLGHSGAVLAWKHLLPGEPVPEFLLRVEDMDLWKWDPQFTENQAFIAGLGSYPLDPDLWLAMMNQPGIIGRLIEDGRAITRYRDTLCETILDGGVIHATTLDGRVRFPAVPAPASIRNEVTRAVMDRFPDAPFAGTYIDTPDGGRKWSLRSADEKADVRAVAEALGGGGHRNAAAFTEAARGEKVRLAGAWSRPAAAPRR
jgi:uncharacterized protein